MSYLRFRNDEESLGTLIKRLLVAYGLDDKLREEKLKLAWFDVVGPLAKAQGGQPVIKRRVMIVPIRSSALRQELTMHKSKILDRLNEAAESPGYLKDLVLR